MHPIRSKHLAVGAPLLVSALLLAGCNGGGGGDDSGPLNISLEFTAKAGNVPVSCGTAIAALGTGALQSQLKDLRFYVSNVNLVDRSGKATPVTLKANDWQDPAGVTLIDLENGTGSCAGGTAATNSAVVGTIPNGDYTGLSLTIGVPSALNHSDFAAAKKPLDIQAMAWSWQSGRKFIKIEVDPVGGVTTPGTPPTPDVVSSTWNMHLGSTGCTGNPATGEVVTCSAPNRVNLTFAGFNTGTQRLVVDLQQLFLNANLSQNLGGALGCMSGKTDPECPAVFPPLGLDIATGLMQNGGANQTVVRAEAK
jgi:uncharacterized repeat protein (TIGR04052 family)